MGRSVEDSAQISRETLAAMQKYNDVMQLACGFYPESMTSVSSPFLSPATDARAALTDPSTDPSLSVQTQLTMAKDPSAGSCCSVSRGMGMLRPVSLPRARQPNA